MVQEYSIVSGEECIGSAHVCRRGLYHHISARCKLTGEVLYRLVVSCDDHKVDLGILVPQDGWFGVETRIPVKRIGEGALIFKAVPSRSTTENFVPISPDEPFRYLSHLEKAYLVRRENELGVVFSD